jgi:hypothetical protein
MKKDVTILRLNDLLELIETVEDQLEDLTPKPTKQYLKGLRAGLTICEKLAKKTAYEAYEYDLHSTAETVKA